MALDAFVLPRAGRSVGVVYWQPARLRRAEAPGRAGADEPLSIYAPGPLSDGERCELLAAYAASLGAELRQGDRPLGHTYALTLWWIAGIAALVLLGVRALTLGPGYAWIAVAAGITALPVGIHGAWRFGRTETAAARRAARRIGSLRAVEGTDRRMVERIAAIWQVARRLHGAEQEQLQTLESHCREQSWAAGAQVYADLLRQHMTGEQAAARKAWRFPALFRGRAARGAPYAAVPMRAW